MNYVTASFTPSSSGFWTAMIVAFRWLLRLFTGLVVLGLLGLVIGYHFLSRSLPDYTKDFTLAGVSAPVEIVRNNANVPHIFGATDEDVYFALGFAHAQDRLWQMTQLRRTAQGRLSEIFGQRTVRIDEILRRYDIYGLALKSADAQDAPTKRALAAYANGVNAWIGQVNSGARGRGAPEFFLFEPEIAVWQPADSIAILKLMALQLSTHMTSEVRRARASLLLEWRRYLAAVVAVAGADVATVPRARPTRPALRRPRPPSRPGRMMTTARAAAGAGEEGVRGGGGGGHWLTH
jgi:penicillin amidase